ncbi:MAG TPA: trypsin-like peptidase domain-containing protein, partial [Dehalococcoidia bacterium]|nr:trypsin-like peptidase domain-containing protein [Dehalococcoidia bacterium]
GAANHWRTGPDAAPTIVTTQPASGSTQLVGLNRLPEGNVASSVYEQVGPSVVQVNVSSQSRGRAWFGGTGSGVVVDDSGLILTNNHVIEGGRTITVQFSDGATRAAKVLGTDSGNDLALLKVDLPSGVPASKLGDSAQVQVGETAIAIGSPFGLAQTVTQGIISAVDRTWSPNNGSLYSGLIQTDAPINPGNSGGPLVNRDGAVIGITSMIESPVSGSVGIGFAVPINTARRLLPQLENGAQLQRAWIGISGTDVGTLASVGEDLPVDEGVLVAGVASNSPAAAAGLRGGQGDNATGGDIIVAVNGQPVKGMAQLAGLIAQQQPGDAIKLTVVRSEREIEVGLTLDRWPEA